jgi:hypothetical protein
VDDPFAFVEQLAAAGPSIPPCPGCGSPPAATDVDDVCPRCGAFLYRCEIVKHVSLVDGTVFTQQVTKPRWTRIPPSQVRVKQLAGDLGKAGTFQDEHMGDADRIIERLLAGPEGVELSPSDMAVLDAILPHPVSLDAVQHQKNVAGHALSEAAQKKLTLIRDFNRGLQTAKNKPADVHLDRGAIAAGQGMLAHMDSLATSNTVVREMVVALGAKHAGGAAPRITLTEAAPAVTIGPPPKRSTERGEGRAKLIAALTKHHQYADGGCLNPEPIGNNELAKAAGVSPSTASVFFDKEFKGHTNYKALCRDTRNLVAALRLLNGEFAPHLLLGDSASNLAAHEERDADAE